jgi:hypothetical protein
MQTKFVYNESNRTDGVKIILVNDVEEEDVKISLVR